MVFLIKKLKFLLLDSPSIIETLMSVSTDTMASHMSAAVGTPVFSWFGPSREKVWRPWMVKYHIISSNYPCSPCGYDGCGGGKISECLNGITDERIRYEINNFMKELEL